MRPVQSIGRYKLYDIQIDRALGKNEICLNVNTYELIRNNAAFQAEDRLSEGQSSEWYYRALYHCMNYLISEKGVVIIH